MINVSLIKQIAIKIHASIQTIFIQYIEYFAKVNRDFREQSLG